MKAGNCRNCGAPPDGSERCPYCGTWKRGRRLRSSITLWADGIRIDCDTGEEAEDEEEGEEP